MALFFIVSWFSHLPNIQSNQSLKVEIKKQTGAAVLIDQELVLTAAHVLVLDEPDINAQINVYCSGVKYKASVVKTDFKSDLALLKLNNKCETVKLAKIAKENPGYGENIYSVGCPNGLCGLLTKGIVSGYSDPDKQNGSWLWSDIQIFFGQSGSGLFLENGELVGICSRLQNFTEVVKHKGKKKHEADIVTAMYSMWAPVSEIRQFLGI